jgi:hypothetical protein
MGVSLFGWLKLELGPRLNLGILRSETEGFDNIPGVLSTAYGITNAIDDSRHEWTHKIEPNAEIYIETVTTRQGGYSWEDYRKAITRSASVEVGGVRAQLVSREESDSHSSGDREVWHLANPKAGTTQIRVTLLVDSVGSPVKNGHVETKSMTLPRGAYGWKLGPPEAGIEFDSGWVKIPHAKRGLSNWLSGPFPGCMIQQAVAHKTTLSTKLSRPAITKGTFVADVLWWPQKFGETLAGKAYEVFKIYRMAKLAAIIEAWRAWRKAREEAE